MGIGLDLNNGDLLSMTAHEPTFVERLARAGVKVGSAAGLLSIILFGVSKFGELVIQAEPLSSGELGSLGVTLMVGLGTALVSSKFIGPCIDANVIVPGVDGQTTIILTGEQPFEEV